MITKTPSVPPGNPPWQRKRLSVNAQHPIPMATILGTATLEPSYRYTSDEIIAAAERNWCHQMDETTRRKALKILKGAQIDHRSSVIPIDEVFTTTSFEEKNNRYIATMIDLGTRVLQLGLDACGLEPTRIDHLITTSCTGYMIPSVDAYIVNRLKMRQDIVRLPVTEMGCAGGTSALIYASHYLNANPGHTVAIVSVEAPSLTFQEKDFSMENIVSTAIFADGAACVILAGKHAAASRSPAPVITGSAMYHFPDQTHLMGYQLKNSGLKIILDRDVPGQIEAHFPSILLPFLQQYHLQPEAIHHYLFHPGGKKIIQMVRDYVSRFHKDITDSLEVLRLNGNMSSATILHILDRFMRKPIPVGDLGYMLAFGPGFMAQSILLEWK